MEEPGLTHGIGGFRNRRDLVGGQEETTSGAGQAATRQCKAWPTGAATVATVHLDPCSLGRSSAARDEPCEDTRPTHAS